MMQKREVSEYSRYSGIKTHRVSKLKTNGLAVLVMAGVIGVCGMATTVMSQASYHKPAESSRTNKAATLTTYPATTNPLTSEPVAILEPLQQNLPNSDSTASKTKTKPAACNQTARIEAQKKHSNQLHSESIRHRHVFRSLQATGVITKFLNPFLYSHRIDRENAKHSHQLEKIELTNKTALKNANC